MAQGRLKKVFPGGNTCQGFFSYYDHIIEPNATRIFVIKGGPGVGKSTFMCHIGEKMLQLGYDVEYHCCSSDNGSLDGVCIPSIGVALLDGTAPHVVDPKHPGAVDTIIHLGDYWNEDLIIKNKDAILKSNARVGKLFKIAYHQLAGARVIQDELTAYYREAVNMAGINKITLDIIDDVLDDAPAQFAREAKVRRLFASAFTPKGPCHHLDTVLQEVKKLYLITGDCTALAYGILGKVADHVYMNGLDSEVFHSTLEPAEVDLVVIPDLEIAVMKEIPFIQFTPQQLVNLKKVKLYNLNKHLNSSILELYGDEITYARERLHSAVHRAVDYIAAAKAEHDVMETYYIPAMNFEAINVRRDDVLAQILKYAEESGNE